jgi:hypothetical protein
VAIAYEAAISTAAAGNGAAYAELYANGTRRAKVREVGMFSQAATAAAKTQLARPANSPAGSSGAVAGVPQDPSDAAGTANLVAAWTTAPTTPTSVFRQFDFNNVIGSGVIFTWPSDGELVVGPARTTANGFVVWNAGSAAGPASDLYAVWSE